MVRTSYSDELTSTWIQLADVNVPTGFLTAVLFTIAVFIFGILLQFRLTRNHVLKRLLPAPGEGPRCLNLANH
jgi:hypothetical protein